MKQQATMARRLLHVTMGMLVLTLLVGGATVLLAASNEDGDGKSKIIEITAPEVHREIVDVGQAGLSPGDQLIVRKLLFLKNRPDKQVGEDHVSCLVTQVKDPHTIACVSNVVYWFEGVGQIVAGGAIFFDLSRPNEFDIAITGGTGEFKDVAGFVHVRQTPGEHFLTFHLNRPAPQALR
jgi:hypothetical protein